MKFLIYSANFAPDLTGIGKYSGDMAQWLVRQGHTVRAVAAPPYYPKWTLDNRYSTYKYKRENLNGIGIWRAPLWVPSSPTGLTRVLHLVSFAVTSVPLMLRQILWRPDAVITVAPAFVCAPMGWLTARLSRAQAWLHLQDFEVDVAFRMGMLKGGLMKRVVQRFERAVLRRFDCVSSISDRMVDLLVQKGVPKARTLLFPNWVDTQGISPDRSGSEYRRELGIAQDAVVVLFSGTLGAKQGLMVLPKVATRLVGRRDIVFVICGDGLLKPQLAAYAQRLPNLHLLPLQPLARLGDLLSMADIHMLPQSPNAADLVMPSKLTGMVASGRPVIATCSPGTEIAKVVTQCGVVVPPEDESALTAAILDLADDPQKRRRLGRRARAWAESNLERDQVLNRAFARYVAELPTESATFNTERVAVTEVDPAEIEDLTQLNLTCLDPAKMHLDHLTPELGDVAEIGADKTKIRA
jgi:colanic acid biosynthesis glycosyl transferase WcaI